MKTIKGKPISPQQVKALHASFKALGMDDENRHNYIAHFTDGRVSSTKELTFDEARRLLGKLNDNNREKVQAEAKAICRSIYALSLKISFLNKSYAESDSTEDFEMNKAKINMFCRTRSKVRKNLTAMSLAELKDVKKQLEAITRKEEQLNTPSK